MVVLTRTEAMVVDNHILDNILGRNDESPLKQSLDYDGIENIFNLISMDKESINTLQYKASKADSSLTNIEKDDICLIKCFAAYYQSLVKSGEEVDWLNVTEAYIGAFCTSPLFQLYLQLSSSSSSAASAASVPPKSDQLSHAALFRRDIKKDSTVFPTLKDEKFHEDWHRSLINQARAQYVSDVIELSYVPVIAEEMEIIEDKQKLVYARNGF
jgi:hypothetical protein